MANAIVEAAEEFRTSDGNEVIKAVDEFRQGSTPAEDKAQVESIQRATEGAAPRGLRSGFNQVGAMLNDIVGQTGVTLGLTDFANDRFADAAEYSARADAIGAPVRDTGSIKNFADLTNFVAFHAASGLATTTPILAATAITKRPIPSVVGVGGAMEAGEQVRTLRDDPSVRARLSDAEILANAAVKGAIGGTLELGGAAGKVARTIAPRRGLRRVIEKPESVPTYLAKAVGGEAVTEAAQDITGQVLHKAVSPDVEIDPRQAVEAAAAGAAGGLGIGGLGAGIVGAKKLTAAALRSRLAKDELPLGEKDLPVGVDAMESPEEIASALEEGDARTSQILREAAREPKYSKFAGFETDAQLREDFIGEVKKERIGQRLAPEFAAIRSASKVEGQRTATDEAVHSTMMKYLPDEYAQNAAPEDLLTLSQNFRGMLQEPGSFRGSRTVTALKRVLGPKYQDFLNEALGNVYSSREGRRQAQQAIEAATGEVETLGKARRQRIDNIVRNNLLPNIAADPALKRVIDETLGESIMDYVEGQGNLSEEFVAGMTEAFGENTEKVLDQLDALRAQPAEKVLEQQELAAPEYQDDPRLNKTFASRLATQDALEGLRKDYAPQVARFRVKAVEETDALGKKRTKYEIIAEDPDQIALSDEEFTDVREPAEFGDTEPGQGVFTIKRTGGLQNKMNAFRLTRLMMRKERQQTREGTLKYVSDMFSRGMSALLNRPDFKDVKIERDEQGRMKLPDNLLIAQIKGQRITYGMLRAAEFGQSPTAIKLRAAIRSAKDPVSRAEAVKGLSEYYTKQQEQADFVNPMVDEALEVLAQQGPEAVDQAVAPMVQAQKGYKPARVVQPSKVGQKPYTESGDPIWRRLQRGIEYVRDQAQFQAEAAVEQEEIETFGTTAQEQEQTGPRKFEEDIGRPVGEEGEKLTPQTQRQVERKPTIREEKEAKDIREEQILTKLAQELEKAGVPSNPLNITDQSLLAMGFTPQGYMVAGAAAEEAKLIKGSADAIKAKMRAAQGAKSTTMQNIVNEWKKMFKIKDDIIVFDRGELIRSPLMDPTLVETNDAATNATASVFNSGVIETGPFGGANGVHMAFSNKWSVIILDDSITDNVFKGQVLAHEFGHAFHRMIFPSLDKDVQLQLATRFAEWLRKRTVKEAAAKGGVARYKIGFRHPAAFANAMLGQENISNLRLDDRNDWYDKFTEWFAEQTSKVILSNPRTLSPLEKVFYEFGKQLRKMYDAVYKYLGRDPTLKVAIKADPSKPDPVFKEFVKGYITGDFRPFLSRETNLLDRVLGLAKIRQDYAESGMLFEESQKISKQMSKIKDEGSIEPAPAVVVGMAEGIRKLQGAKLPEPGSPELVVGMAEGLRKLREARLSKMDIGDKKITPEQEAEIRAYVEKVLGKKDTQVIFEKLEAAGEFADLSGVETLKISVDAIDPRGVGYHEAMHAFFARLIKADKRAARILMNAAEAAPVVARLRQLLKNHPEALEQLKDPEERLAYAYQFWAAGDKSLFSVGPETQTVFKRVQAFFKRLMALWTDDIDLANSVKAGEILNAFHNGAFADRSTVAAVLEREVPKSQYEAIDDVWPALGTFMDKYMLTATGAVRDYGIAPMTKIMDKFHIRTGTEGTEPGFLQSKHVVYNQFLNRIAEVVKDMTEEQQQAVMAEVRAGSPTTPAGREIRAVLDEAFVYLVKSNVKTVVREDGKPKLDANGDPVYKPLQRVDNYFPRVFDVEYMRGHFTEFLALMKKYEIKNGEAIYNNIATDMNQVENAQGDETLDLTFYAPFTQERTLGSIPDSELAPFLNKDLFGTLSQYLARAARRGEYTRRFGNSGEEIVAAREEATAAGATPRQLQIFDDAVKAMEGTLGADMSPQLRTAFAAITTYQNIRLLPLALFSSFVDPMGIMVRGGTLGDAMQAFFRGLREVFSVRQDYKYNLARLSGAINIANDVQVVSDMYSSQFMSPMFKRINDVFFKYNGMEAWNRSMRTSAAAAAENFILHHAFEPEEHSDRYLRELNLTRADIQENPETSGLVLNDKTKTAINLWVDQAILRPNAAMRPIYMSDPNWILVSHLKQFMYLLQQTIINRVANEMKHGNVTPMFALSSYVPVMIMSDAVRAILTPGGGDDREDWDMTDWLWQGVQRAGLFGPGQMVLDSGADLRYGGRSSILGPTAEQALEFAGNVLGGGNVGGDVARAIPGVRYFM